VNKYEFTKEERWWYQASDIWFKDGRLYKWHEYTTPLKIFLGYARPDAENVRFGVSRKAVVDALGTPRAVDRYPTARKDIWWYGSSQISFKDGMVSEWRQGSEDLRLGAGPNGRFVDDGDATRITYVYQQTTFPAAFEQDLYSGMFGPKGRFNDDGGHGMPGSES